MAVAGFLQVKADRYTKACQNSYLNPHPVPPRTIAARRIAPAMDPIMILVPLGPAQRKEGGRKGAEEEEEEEEGEGQKQNNTTKKHTSEDSINTVHERHQLERGRERQREAGGGIPVDRERQRERERAMEGQRRKPAHLGGGGRAGG